MKLYFKVPESETSPNPAEPTSSERPNCVTSPQPEVTLRTMENPSENHVSTPHVNVIVKQEEEEEPLYGTSKYSQYPAQYLLN